MEQADLMKNLTKELFSKMGFEPSQIDILEGDSVKSSNMISVKIENPGLLIGEKGANLTYIEHILRLLISKKIENAPRFVLDINNYKKDREEYLKELARETAKKVAATKQPVSLFPMSAFERRIIHMELSNRPDIITESSGQKEERSVFIKPKI